MANLYCNCTDCIVKNLVFEFMDRSIQEEICTSKKEIHYKKGEKIIIEGQEIIDFAYIRTGLVKLHQIKPNHRDSIIYIAKPYDFVTLLTIFSETHYKYSLTAIEDTDVCFFNLNKIKQLSLSNSNFSFGLISKMSSVSDKIISHYTEINQKNLRGRIAFILLKFSMEIYSNQTFTLPITRKEMAELIGMTTENVIRILSEFNKDGIIEIKGKRIEILSLERLNAIAEKG